MTKRGLIVILMALFVVAGLGSAFAAQTNGMATNNGLPLPTNAPEVIGGATTGLDAYVNPDGLGDTLIYNYFTARSGMGTYFDVVNTSASYIRARVRFHEAKDIAGSTCNQGSWEILDFDICLTPKDVWSGYVVQSGDHGVLCSSDTHTLVYDGVTGNKTFPVLATGSASATSGCVSFKFGSANPISQIDADATLEGYFTIIGEAEIDGTPYTCDPQADGGESIGDAGNVLFGSAMFADLTDPTNSPFYEYNATAIADFDNVAINATVGGATETPRLIDGGDGITGINYILTKSHLYGTYLLDASAANGGQWATEYILTFPTKRYTENIDGVCGNSIFTPDTVNITKYDMDENPDLPSGCSFSPCPPGTTDHIPYELNIITVSKKNTTANKVMPTSPNRVSGIIAVPTTFDRGWVDIDLTNDTASRWTVITDVSGTMTAHGWPVLALQLVNNKNYSSAFPMRALTDITQP